MKILRVTVRLFLWGLGISASLAAVAAPAGKPNIILMLCDDLGYRDVACFGDTRYQTPNVDRLAKEGFKLTQFYSASAVCTPTRASVITGKYPLRFDIRAVFQDTGQTLPPCPTLPKTLQAAGYRTAHVGKWHLGGVRLKDCAMRDKSPGPREHGFDHYLTQIEEQPKRGEMIKARTLYRQGGTCLLRDDKQVDKTDPYFPMHFTDLMAEESMRLIRQFQAEGKPFFLNLWWMVPHTPLEPSQEPFWSQTAAPGISDAQHCFRSMVVHMDFQIGRILKLLDDLKITDNTLVVFTSDNGGAAEANIGELKGGTTDLHEGGIRVPFIARWPGRINQGKEHTTPGISVDLFPTFCAAAGVPMPAGEKFDGINLLPLLAGQTAMLERSTLFWQLNLMKNIQRHYPKPMPYATEVARKGRWKLLAFEGKPVELFDIESDVREEKNLVAEKPELVESLRQELAVWLAEPRTPFLKIP